MIKFVKKHPWILIVLVGLFLVPQSLTIQSQLNERLILTGMAVDKSEDGYEVVAQVVIAGSSAGAVGESGKVDFIKTKGKTISECANEISYLLGKTAGFTHVNFVVFGKDLAKEEGIIDALDYFVRDRKVPSSALVLISEGKAGEELVKTQNMELDSAVGLQRLFIHKQTAMNGTMMQIQEVFDNYFNISSSSIISEFKIVDEQAMAQGKEQSGGSQGGSSESGGSSGDSGGGLSGGSSSSDSSGGGSASGGAEGGSQSENNKPPSKPRVEFEPNIYLLKQGKIVAEITDKDELIAINLLNPNGEEGIISIDGVSDDVFNDATIGVRVYQKKAKFKAYFDEDGNPHFKITVDLKKNEVQEINSKDISERMYDSSKVYLTDALIERLETYSRESILSVCKTAREANVDFLNCGNRLYQKDAKKWKKFLSSIQNADDYLQYVNFEVEVIARKDT